MEKPLYAVQADNTIVMNAYDGSVHKLSPQETTDRLNDLVARVDFLIKLYGHNHPEFMFPDGVLWVVRDA